MKVSLSRTVCLFASLLLASCADTPERDDEPSIERTEQALLKPAAWVALPHGMTGPDGGMPPVYQIAVDEKISALVYAGASGGLYTSLSFGQSWSLAPDVRNPQYPFRVGHVVVDPSRFGTAYAVVSYNYETQSAGTVFGTTNAHRGWSALLERGFESITGISVAPDDSNVIYVSAFARAGRDLLRSSDRGATWQNVYTGAIPCCYQLVMLSKQHMYGLTFYDQHLTETTDGGATWTSLDESTLLDLAVDRRKPSVLYAARLDSLVKSTDGGHTWAALSTPFAAGSARSVSVSPADSRLYVIAVQDEQWTAYASTDGGATFRAISEGLPTTRVNSITPDPRLPCVAYAATESGAFRTVTAGGSCR
jgi:photosystem II stability/assembly factor-like uncharacterized protein